MASQNFIHQEILMNFFIYLEMCSRVYVESSQVLSGSFKAYILDGDIKGYPQLEEILLNIVPLGFSPSRVIVHNIAVILMKTFSTERLYILEGKDNAKILNLLVTLL